MAEMHHSPERGYTVTLTDTEYDALKAKALERDALAAELARLRAIHDELELESVELARQLANRPGFEYSTEVVTIAREALEQVPK